MAASSLASLALALFLFVSTVATRELIGYQKIDNNNANIVSAPNESEEQSTNSGLFAGAGNAVTTIPSVPSLPNIPGIPTPGSLPIIGARPSTPFSGSTPSIPTAPIPGIGSNPIFPPPLGGLPSYGNPSGHTSRLPGTCKYWESNPASWPDLVSNISTISNVFGRTAAAMFGGDMTLLEALENDRNGAYGYLLREATASLLNSYASDKFPFTADDVKKSFNRALVSPKDAAAQGNLFAKANGIGY